MDIGQNSRKSDGVPLLGAVQEDDELDLDQEIPPLSHFPTPPKKSTQAPAPTANEHEFSAALQTNRRSSIAPAPGLRAIPVGTAAEQNPPERPQNERLRKAFLEQAERDSESRGTKAAADRGANRACDGVSMV